MLYCLCFLAVLLHRGLCCGMIRPKSSREGTTEITTQLVRQLLADQVPQWRALEVRGGDNRIFHLGSAMAVRLPRGWYDADRDVPVRIHGFRKLEKRMKFVLLLRGINVGGKRKVNMEELKQQLTGLGCTNVISYINSGNLIFEAGNCVDIQSAIENMLAEHYGFEIPFALIPGEDYEKTVETLPDWWKSGDLARRDALFFTAGVTRELVRARIGTMKLHDEIVYDTDIAVFWGKIHETEYLKTAYHKYLGAEDFYKKVTIRNGNTVGKILELLTQEGNPVKDADHAKRPCHRRDSAK